VVAAAGRGLALVPNVLIEVKEEKTWDRRGDNRYQGPLGQETSKHSLHSKLKRRVRIQRGVFRGNAGKRDHHTGKDKARVLDKVGYRRSSIKGITANRAGVRERENREASGETDKVTAFKPP